MSDMDRDGQMHTSHPAASEKPSLDQLEATFETAVSDGFVLTARLTDLQQTWLQRTSAKSSPCDLNRCHLRSLSRGCGRELLFQPGPTGLVRDR
jgi:hypothetical protein